MPTGQAAVAGCNVNIKPPFAQHTNICDQLRKQHDAKLPRALLSAHYGAHPGDTIPVALG
jgi:hypothetical protein